MLITLHLPHSTPARSCVHVKGALEKSKVTGMSIILDSPAPCDLAVYLIKFEAIAFKGIIKEGMTSTTMIETGSTFRRILHSDLPTCVSVSCEGSWDKPVFIGQATVVLTVD